MGAGATSLSKEQAMKFKEFDAAKWEGLGKDAAGLVAVEALLPLAPKVTCYTADVSICSIICRLAAEEHGVPCLEHRNVDIECEMENYEAWFVKIQPKMTVPCMQYGDDVIGDSKDIMYYLAEKHPGAGLYPEDRKADIDAFVELFYSKFGSIARFTFGHWIHSSDAIRNFIDRGKVEKSIEKLRKLIADYPELRDVGEAKLATKQKFNFVEFMSKVDLGEMDRSMGEVLAAVEAKLEKTAFVCGDTYTLADVTATAFLARVHVVKAETMFGPATAKYWNEAIKTRPSFQKAYVTWKWELTLMHKQVEALARGEEPETVTWAGPPAVL